MPVETIVVAGGGLAGWLAASMLAARLEDVRILLIESPDAETSLGLAMPVEALLPTDIEALESAGFAPDAIVRAAEGSASLGTALSGWQPGAPPTFLPFGEFGAPIGPVAFNQLAGRLRHAGKPINLANYALAALCAQSGRFAPPSTTDRSVHATLTHGLHVNVAALARGIRADAIARGVVAVAGRVRAAETGAGGLASALLTDRGERIAGDLFIDALGPDSVLAGPFEDWGHWLPCDRAAIALRPSADALPLFAHVDAHAAGWQGFIPHQGGVGDSLLYCDAAMREGPPATAFRCGRQTHPWRGNILSIGGAAAVIDPVAGTQFHLALVGIVRLLSLLPANRVCRAESAEYNRQTIEVLECARDYAILHYKANGRTGEAFWDACRAMSVPDRLAHRIALYESCGRVALHDGETFDAAAWTALFEAQGVRPRRHDALANGIAIEQIEEHFERVRSVMLQAVAGIPPHAAWLEGRIR